MIKTIKVLQLVIIFGVMMTYRIGNANTMEQNLFYFHDVVPDIITPHHTWAKPLTSGPVRILIVGPYRGQRETIELWQRLDMQYSVVAVFASNKLGSQEKKSLLSLKNEHQTHRSGIENRLREMMKKDFDVVIVARTRWHILPDFFRQWVMDKNSSGMGLIFTFYAPRFDSKNYQAVPVTNEQELRESLANGIPLNTTGAKQQWYSKTNKLLMPHLLRLGKGKIAFFPFTPGENNGRWQRPMLTPSIAWLASAQKEDQEYYYGILIRSILWAAGRNFNDALIGKKVLGTEYATKMETDPGRRIFPWIIWADSNNEYINQLELQRLKSLGFTPHIPFCYKSDPTITQIQRDNAEKLNLSPTLYIWNYYPPQDAKKGPLIRGKCLTDPIYMGEMEKRVAENTKIFCSSNFRPLGYSLGDENALGWANYVDRCWSPTCLADFRAYLKERYASLDAVNIEWETSYTSWNEVMPIKVRAIRTEGDVAHWVDWRDHMAEVFTHAHVKGRNIIRKIDPHAKVGLDGPLPPYWIHGGIDPWKLTRKLDLYVGYDDELHNELIRSWASKDAITGIWMGYGRDAGERYIRWFPWYLACHGFSSIWYFSASYVGESMLAADLRIQPFGKWAINELNKMRNDGLDKLIIESSSDNTSIGIVFSQISHYSTGWKNYYYVSEHYMSANGAIHLIEDMGNQYVMLSPEQLCENTFADSQTRLLILPNVQALSVSQVKAIKRFVKNGGVLLADLMPGIKDGHGKTIDKGSPLASLFKESDQCFLLGKSFRFYDEKRNSNELSQWSMQISHLLNMAKIEPIAKLSNQLGIKPVGCELFCLKNSRGTVVALLVYPKKQFHVGSNEKAEKRLFNIETPKGKYTINLPAGKWELLMLRGAGAKAKKQTCKIFNLQLTPGSVYLFEQKNGIK